MNTPDIQPNASEEEKKRIEKEFALDMANKKKNKPNSKIIHVEA